MFWAKIMGKSGSFRTNGPQLPICDCPGTKSGSSDFACHAESLDSLFHLGHEPNIYSDQPFPFVCPACNFTFASQSDVDKEQAPSKMSKYIEAHRCVIWHHRPLVPVLPTRIVVNTLHFFLSSVKKLYKSFILSNVNTKIQVSFGYFHDSSCFSLFF